MDPSPPSTFLRLSGDGKDDADDNDDDDDPLATTGVDLGGRRALVLLRRRDELLGRGGSNDACAYCRRSKLEKN